VSEEICNCGHRKSQHKAIVCGWWSCHCKQFQPLTAEPKREQKPFEEFPYAGDIISADLAAQEVITADVAAQDVSADVATQEVEQLRSRLRAAQEEIGRLKQLQDGNHMLANRLGAENNLLREALSEIKRLVEAILART
jgi:hypothetical protein